MGLVPGRPGWFKAEERKPRYARAAQRLFGLEVKTRSGDQIAKRCGDQNFPGVRLRMNLAGNIHGDTPNRLSRDYAFACVQPGIYRRTQCTRVPGNRGDTTDCARRAVE